MTPSQFSAVANIDSALKNLKMAIEVGKEHGIKSKFTLEDLNASDGVLGQELGLIMACGIPVSKSGDVPNQKVSEPVEASAD